MSVSLQRRCALAVIGLSCAGILCRGFVAEALVTRGDDYLRSGAVAESRVYFERAARIDPDAGSAVERYAFASLQERNPAALESGIALARTYLARHGDAAAIRVDLALALYAAQKDREAVPELLRAARDARDFRLFGLAAHAALRAGDAAVARSAFRSALELDPGYGPARLALGGERP